MAAEAAGGTPIAEVRVSSWADLDAALFEGSYNATLGRHRSPYAFRGEAHASETLTTSLMRMGHGFERVEAPMLRAFRKYAHGSPVLGDSPWLWLALAQHHGLPTRLLDWTYAPHVALHFATRGLESLDLDGVVWQVNYIALATTLPDQLREVLRTEEADVLTVEMLDRAAPTLNDLAALASDPFGLFLEPPSLDARIVNQYALFATMSHPAARLDTWLAGTAPDLARRIVIPAGLKAEVRDRLDQLNVTERVLFPGLDGLSQWLRRYYTPISPAVEVAARPAHGRVGGFQSGFHARWAERSDAVFADYLVCGHDCQRVIQLVSHISGEVELELCAEEAERLAGVLGSAVADSRRE